MIRPWRDSNGFSRNKERIQVNKLARVDELANRQACRQAGMTGARSLVDEMFIWW